MRISDWSSDVCSSDLADIIAAHAEQDGIDAVLDQRPDQRGLDRLDIEIAGQRRHRPAAIGIGRAPQIIADQPELGVARPRVDERIEKRGESVHGNVNAYATRAAPERGGYVVRPIPAYEIGRAHG